MRYWRVFYRTIDRDGRGMRKIQNFLSLLMAILTALMVTHVSDQEASKKLMQLEEAAPTFLTTPWKELSLKKNSFASVNPPERFPSLWEEGYQGVDLEGLSSSLTLADGTVVSQDGTEITFLTDVAHYHLYAEEGQIRVSYSLTYIVWLLFFILVVSGFGIAWVILYIVFTLGGVIQSCVHSFKEAYREQLLEESSKQEKKEENSSEEEEDEDDDDEDDDDDSDDEEEDDDDEE